MSMHDHSEYDGTPDHHRTRVGWVLGGFLLIAGALLFTEHRAHVLGLLIWLPLLACPLMHMFMHGGHGGHGGHDQQNKEGRPS